MKLFFFLFDDKYFWTTAYSITFSRNNFDATIVNDRVTKGFAKPYFALILRYTKF